MHFDSSSLQKGGVGVSDGGTVHVVGWLLATAPVAQAFIAFTLHSYVFPGVLGKLNFVEGAWTVPDLMMFLVAVLTIVILYVTAFGDVSHVQVDSEAAASEHVVVGDCDGCKLLVEALPRSCCWFWISLTVKNTPISSIIARRAIPALFAGTDLFFIES